MASGIFIVPILTLLANVDVHLAIGASSRLRNRLLLWKRWAVPQGAPDKRAARYRAGDGDHAWRSERRAAVRRGSGSDPLRDFRRGPFGLRLADADTPAGRRHPC